jgi:prepilin-type N-terminal cleavage/methylation domain-containing protein
MPRAERRGFTLIEVIVGLALAGVVFTSTLLLVDQLRDGRDRLLEGARRDNRAANGAELLRVLVARAELSGGPIERFIGTDSAVQFRSWCDVPGGWLERCVVRVFAVRARDSSFVNADLSTGERLILMATVEDVAFRYFDAVGYGRWATESSSSMTLPAAVAVIVGRDTVVMTAGGRG